MYAELAIYCDDLEPSVVTQILGLQPSMTWKSGDVKNQRTGATYDSGCWKLQTSSNDGPLEDHIKNLMELCSGCIDSIRSLGNDKNVSVEVSAVIHLKEYAPDLCLSNGIIAWMSDIGASLDIDMYFK